MIIGKGSYGIIQANPRLPFINEKVKNIKNKREVSKIFTNHDEALKEFYIYQKFINYFCKEDLYKIADYLVFPISGGSLDINEINLHQDIYSRRIYNLLLTNQLDTFIISYPQGSNNLNEELTKINNFDDFKNYLKKTLNILDGIRLLLKNNFVHFDLKNLNMISINDQFKIIDLANINCLKDKFKNDLPAGNMLYFIWPFTHIYTLFFVNQENPIIYLNSRLFINQYSIFKKQNLESYEYIKNYFINGFDVSLEMGFSQEEINLIKKIQMDLLLQKLYKDPEILNDEDKNIVFKILEEKNLDLSLFKEELLLNATKSLFKKFNSNFSKFSNTFELKQDIFKRTDIYSFGMLILTIIHHYFKVLKNTYNNLLVQEKDFIIQLFKFIYLCCYQKEKVVDFDLIYQEFKKIII